MIRETTEMLGQQIENNANEILAAASGERGAIVDAAHSQAYTKVVSEWRVAYGSLPFTTRV